MEKNVDLSLSAVRFIIDFYYARDEKKQICFFSPLSSLTSLSLFVLLFLFLLLQFENDCRTLGCFKSN